MSKRKIIEIERNKCTGCGLCTTACAEGALVLDKENKAVLAKEIFCDGLGACLNVCPADALHIVERDAAEYDAQATYKHVLSTRGPLAAKDVHGATHPHSSFLSPSLNKRGGEDVPSSARDRREGELACGCPGTMAKEIKKASSPTTFSKSGEGELSQWPIQLHLVSPVAPYFQNCDLLIAADCTAFTLGSFHQDLLKGKKLIIACPKLDDTTEYVDKIAEIIKNNTVYSLTVAIMTVPCCSGMYQIAEEAVEKSGKNIAIKKVVINLEGGIVS